MDELADLIAALARFEERARKPKKRKKVKTTGRPAKMGPSAGCGTGSGGFKAGNNCAKEDGIPQRPLSQGGALKGANAKDDFARAKAMKEKAAAKKAAAAEKPKEEEAEAEAEEVSTYKWKHDFGKGETEYERLDLNGMAYVYDLKSKAYLGAYIEKTNKLNNKPNR
jgi:hypothetical protein